MDEQITERTAGQATAQRIIGARIREFREAAGLSQAELARRVYVSRQTVGNWEAGRTLADVQSLVLLSQVFGTTVDAIIGEKGARAVTPQRGPCSAGSAGRARSGPWRGPRRS